MAMATAQSLHKRGWYQHALLRVVIFLLLLVQFSSSQQTRTVFDSIYELSPGGLVSADEAFGRSVAFTDDLNGNGFPEMAVGVPEYQGAGAVLVQFPDALGASIDSTVVIRASDIPGGVVTAGSRFGWSVAYIGDIDPGNGTPDHVLAIGEPGEDGVDGGRVYLVWLTAPGVLPITQWRVLKDDNSGIDISTILAGDNFGYSMDAADLNGDGIADLVVGLPGADEGVSGGNADTGAVMFLELSSSGAVTHFEYISGQVLTSFLTAGSRMGVSVALGDLDGSSDLGVDVCVGVQSSQSFPQQSALLLIFLRKPNAAVFIKGVKEISTGKNLIPDGLIKDYEHFGSSITFIPDVNQDGVIDLLVGVSNATAGGVVGVGRVVLLNLAASGVYEHHSEISTDDSNSPLFGQTLHESGHFGSSVTYMAHSGSSASLVVGASHAGITDKGRLYHFPLSVKRTCEPIATDNGYFEHTDFRSAVYNCAHAKRGNNIFTDAFTEGDQCSLECFTAWSNYPNRLQYTTCGATGDWSSGVFCRGMAYVYSANATFAPSSMTPFAKSLLIDGDASGMEVGYAMDAMNTNDGGSDFAVGAPGFSSDKGAAFVFYGDYPSNFDSFNPISIATLLGADRAQQFSGFVDGDRLGSNLVSMGPYSADSLDNNPSDDVMLFSKGAADGYKGRYYSIRETNSAKHPTGIDLSVRPNPTDIVIEGTLGGLTNRDETTGYQAGMATGDFNGDGLLDSLHAGHWPSGSVYVVWHVTVNATVYPLSEVQLTPSATEVTRIRIGIGFNHLTSGVACVSDVNGDGVDDFAIAVRAGLDETGIFLIYGGVGLRFVEDLILPSPIKSVIEAYGGTVGFTFFQHPDWLYSTALNDFLGNNTRYTPRPFALGDINNDGRADWAISADAFPLTGDFNNSGTVYVILGYSGGANIYNQLYVDLSSDLSTYSPYPVMQLMGPRDRGRFGHTVTRLGDWNGDGVDDFAVGEYRQGWRNTGARAYIVFGRDQDSCPFNERNFFAWDAETLTGYDGLAINIDTVVGGATNVAGDQAFDLNGDGLMDLLVGVPNYNSDSGRVHVLYGTQTVEYDECTSGKHSCDPVMGECQEREGFCGYDCTCIAGSEGDGFNCTDSNQCMAGHLCTLYMDAGTPAGQSQVLATECIDKPFPSLNYSCDCPAGFVVHDRPQFPDFEISCLPDPCTPNILQPSENACTVDGDEEADCVPSPFKYPYTYGAVVGTPWDVSQFNHTCECSSPQYILIGEDDNAPRCVPSDCHRDLCEFWGDSGAVCVEGADYSSTDDYTCQCTMGPYTFDGQMCTNICPRFAIHAFSADADAVDDKKCECLPGFFSTVFYNEDEGEWQGECQVLPCPEFAETENCTCSEGYLGNIVFNGTAWVGECALATCPATTAHGTGKFDSHMCLCEPGKGGLSFDYGVGWGGVCVDLDECLSSPCKNGGNCSADGLALTEYKCTCEVGYAGYSCELDQDDCASDPCLNNGACQDIGTNAFRCDCQNTGFFGGLCQTDIDDCDPPPCFNDGVCSNNVGDRANPFNCTCQDLWIGATCQDRRNQPPQWVGEASLVKMNEDGKPYTLQISGYYTDDSDIFPNDRVPLVVLHTEPRLGQVVCGGNVMGKGDVFARMPTSDETTVNCNLLANGVLYAPMRHANGKEELSFSVIDHAGLTVNGTVELDIASINDRPEVQDVPETNNGEDPLLAIAEDRMNYTFVIRDVDSDNLVVQVIYHVAVGNLYTDSSPISKNAAYSIQSSGAEGSVSQQEMSLMSSARGHRLLKRRVSVVYAGLGDSRFAGGDMHSRALLQSNNDDEVDFVETAAISTSNANLLANGSYFLLDRKSNVTAGEYSFRVAFDNNDNGAKFPMGHLTLYVWDKPNVGKYSDQFRLGYTLDTQCPLEHGTQANVWSSGPVCEICPVGAVCVDDGRLKPTNKYGFWESKREPNTYVKCAPLNACPADTNGTCLGGYGGTQCGDCQAFDGANYYRQDGVCNRCEDVTLIMYTIIISVIILACAVLLWMATYGRFLFKISGVVATFFQTLVEFSTIELEWTERVKKMFQVISVFNIDLEFLEVECSMPANSDAIDAYTIKYLGTMVIPMFILVGLVIVYLLHTAIRVRKLARDKKFEYLLTRAFTIFIVFAYFPLVSQGLSFFDCSQAPDGNYVMDASPGLSCFDPWWWKFLPFAIAGLSLYGLCVPLYIIIALRSHPHYGYNLKKSPFEPFNMAKVFAGKNKNVVYAVHDKAGYEESLVTWNEKYSTLTLQYHTRTYYWELLVLSRKLSITFLRIFGTKYPVFQTTFITLVLLLYILLQRDYRPFVESSVNQLELGCLLVSVFILLLGVMLNGEDGFNGVTKEILGDLIIVVVCGAVLYMIYLIVRFMIKEWCKQIKTGASFGDIEEDDEMSQDPHIRLAEQCVRAYQETSQFMLVREDVERLLLDFSEDYYQHLDDKHVEENVKTKENERKHRAKLAAALAVAKQELVNEVKTDKQIVQAIAELKDKEAKVARFLTRANAVKPGSALAVKLGKQAAKIKAEIMTEQKKLDVHIKKRELLKGKVQKLTSEEHESKKTLHDLGNTETVKQRAVKMAAELGLPNRDDEGKASGREWRVDGNGKRFLVDKYGLRV